jgi:hypothetical protein
MGDSEKGENPHPYNHLNGYYVSLFKYNISLLSVAET